MSVLFPCDLGDGIEVVHDVEQIEIELDCDVDDDPWYSAPYEKIEILCEPAPAFPADDGPRERVAALDLLKLYAFERSPVLDTLPFAPYEPNDLRDDSSPAFVLNTMTETTPYTRIDGGTLPFVKQ